MLDDGRLQKNVVPVVFEIMIRDRDEERLALNFAASLKRIGIEANPRLYDEVQHQRRRQRFEYDMMTGQWLATAVPGRILLSGFFSVPLQHTKAIWCAHGAAIRHPERMPLVPMYPFGFSLGNWWTQSVQSR